MHAHVLKRPRMLKARWWIRLEGVLQRVGVQWDECEQQDEGPPQREQWDEGLPHVMMRTQAASCAQRTFSVAQD